MKIVKTVAIMIFLVSCSNFGDPVDSDSIKNKQRTREVIEQTATEFGGSICEDENSNHDCSDQCREVYKSRTDRNTCEELTTGQVKQLSNLYDILENTRDEELQTVDVDIFELYIRISVDSLIDLAEDYSPRQSKSIIIWLIETPEIVKLVQNEDDEYKFLENVLKEIATYSNDADIYKPFAARVEGRDHLMELAINTNVGQDEVILDWFQDFINEKNSNCNRDSETIACFQIYCKIGESLRAAAARDNWLGGQAFSGYISDIIDEKVNSTTGSGSNANTNGWIHQDENRNNGIGRINDLNDWTEDLKCRQI